tara:strand:+ start:523 stop:708 length:186 start_codon:yes stop_codon:yes gene_type:complete
MVKLIKKTIYYEGMPLRPLKMGKISILTGKNLAKKINIKKEKNNGKIKSNSGKKSKSVTKT